MTPSRMSGSMNANANMPPNEDPASSMENVHSRILPSYCDSGIHGGTDAADGIMYGRMTSGAMAGNGRGANDVLRDGQRQHAIAAEPMFSISVTTIKSRACSLHHTSANAFSGLSDTRPWNSGRSRKRVTADRIINPITTHASSDSSNARVRAAAAPSASAPIKSRMVTTGSSPP